MGGKHKHCCFRQQGQERRGQGSRKEATSSPLVSPKHRPMQACLLQDVQVCESTGEPCVIPSFTSWVRRQPGAAAVADEGVEHARFDLRQLHQLTANLGKEPHTHVTILTCLYIIYYIIYTFMRSFEKLCRTDSTTITTL